MFRGGANQVFEAKNECTNVSFCCQDPSAPTGANDPNEMSELTHIGRTLCKTQFYVMKFGMGGFGEPEVSVLAADFT